MSEDGRILLIVLFLIPAFVVGVMATGRQSDRAQEPRETFDPDYPLHHISACARLDNGQCWRPIVPTVACPNGKMYAPVTPGTDLDKLCLGPQVVTP